MEANSDDCTVLYFLRYRSRMSRSLMVLALGNVATHVNHVRGPEPYVEYVTLTGE